MNRRRKRVVHLGLIISSLMIITYGADEVAARLKTNNVPHIWNVEGNAHDTPEWKNDLYWFSHQLFK
jgi:hypothetical protein